MKPLIFFFIILGITATLLLLKTRPLFGSTLSNAELVVGALVTMVVVVIWRVVSRRNARRKVDEIRDSALW